MRYAAAVEVPGGGYRRVGLSSGGTVKWYKPKYRGSFNASEVERVKRFARKRGTGRVRITPINPYPNLVGDLDCNAELLRKLQGVAKTLGVTIRVREGRRTRAEQQAHWDRYQAGKGPLAARPGTSRHETGNAADCGINGLDIGDYPGAVGALKYWGLGLPVKGEDWHVEITDSMVGAAS